MSYRFLVISILVLSVSSCSVTGITSSYHADSFFRAHEYQKGIEYFSEKVRSEPASDHDNYFLGRFYLAEKTPSKALPYLQRAVYFNPDKADYHFWLGIAYGELGNDFEEQKHYRNALRENPSHAKARLYSAHFLLKNQDYTKALKLYEDLLDDYPFNASALYNRALCLKLLGQEKSEERAWQEYLKYYPSGFLAAKAANHLNLLGNFSYRNHQFGFRTVTLKEISFSPQKQNLLFDARASMRLVGGIVSNMQRGDLIVTVFYNGSEKIAKERTVNLKNYLLGEYPLLDANRIKLSWFSSPEKLYLKGRQYVNNESVRLYLKNWEQVR